MSNKQVKDILPFFIFTRFCRSRFYIATNYFPQNKKPPAGLLLNLKTISIFSDTTIIEHLMSLHHPLIALDPYFI